MFITFEGIEGAGKTTQVKQILKFLRNKGLNCIMTREPGSTCIGKKIRAILLDPENTNMDGLTELLLYMADRTQHVKEIIKPALSEGKIVLCDRYFDATVAYQGFARGLSIDFIKKLYSLLLDDLKPDLTFLLDLSPQAGLTRAWEQIQTGTRSVAETRFEKETLAFHQTVRAGYLELAQHEPKRFRIIDADTDEHQVQEEIIKILNGILGSTTPRLKTEAAL